MTGSVRRRRDGKYWEYVVEAGRRTRWTCGADGCRWGTWSPVEGNDGCPHHPDSEVATAVRRRQVSKSGFTRKRDAEQAMRVALVDLDAGRVTPPAQLTVGDYLILEWLPAVETTVRPATYHQYRQMVRLHVVPRIGAVALRDLEPAHLDRLYAELLRTGRRLGEGGLSPKTVRHVHVTVRKALTDAVHKGRATRNVAEHASPPKLRRARPRVWDADQIRAFLDHVTDDRFVAAWTLLATTGMRRGEVLGLRWSDIDLTAATATVAQQITTIAHHALISEPKTARGRRTIALDVDTVATLRVHADRQADAVLKAGSLWQETGLLFVREDGAFVHPKLLSKRFEALCRQACLPHIGIHGLRHSYATLALRARVPAQVVSQRLGHANVTVTLDVYGHVMPGMDADAAARVADVIRGTS